VPLLRRVAPPESSAVRRGKVAGTLKNRAECAFKVRTLGGGESFRCQDAQRGVNRSGTGIRIAKQTMARAALASLAWARSLQQLISGP